jgi:hypothetical protein
LHIVVAEAAGAAIGNNYRGKRRHNAAQPGIPVLQRIEWRDLNWNLKRIDLAENHRGPHSRLQKDARQQQGSQKPPQYLHPIIPLKPYS